MERPYSTLGYPVTPVIFVGTSVFFVINTLIERPRHAWVGLIFTLIGVGVYFLFRRRKEAKA
jgi:APA family basic amino acid/polyamine antiporter